eukprot:326070-Amphidinium_carterae.1
MVAKYEVAHDKWSTCCSSNGHGLQDSNRQRCMALVAFHRACAPTRQSSHVSSYCFWRIFPKTHECYVGPDRM